ncbi:hypothetical protein T265_06909 [Opisthorchis viverrini]|uniref:Uncharacterized protein n=1 Tax=Opisthorchis viverrini TaxID=6198 RepID=A0A075ACX1_OPIVI|nr:hypothetical protein T265_06909 [Opisthorchis viverrini]KER25674.1 hypothetical protein T265_06909 [Opisthorchis viverrini]
MPSLISGQKTMAYEIQDNAFSARLLPFFSVLPEPCQVIHCPPLSHFYSDEEWGKRALRGRRSTGMRDTCPDQCNL